MEVSAAGKGRPHRLTAQTHRLVKNFLCACLVLPGTTNILAVTSFDRLLSRLLGQAARKFELKKKINKKRRPQPAQERIPSAASSSTGQRSFVGGRHWLFAKTPPRAAAQSSSKCPQHKVTRDLPWGHDVVYILNQRTSSGRFAEGKKKKKVKYCFGDIQTKCESPVVRGR